MAALSRIQRAIVMEAFSQVNSRPVATLLITGEGRFPQTLDFFKGLRIGVPSGCLENPRFLCPRP